VASVSSCLRQYLEWKARGDEVEGASSEKEGALEIGACDSTGEDGPARAPPVRQEHKLSTAQLPFRFLGMNSTSDCCIDS
jgi:hypothetical protein